MWQNEGLAVTKVGSRVRLRGHLPTLDGLLSFYENDLPHPFALSCEIRHVEAQMGESKGPGF